VRLHADMIPRHGEVTRGQDKVIDPVAKAISRAYTAVHGGDGIPRLKQAFDPIEKELQQAVAALQQAPNDLGRQQEVTALKARVRHHECPMAFCPTYDPKNPTPDDRQDAKELCHLVPGRPDVLGNYVSAVMPWQRAVADYCWGSRRSMLLQAQTGSGKSVVTAYAIELMQTIDKGQGGYLGLTPEETNIALLLFTKPLMGQGPDEYLNEVYGHLQTRLDPEVVHHLRDGQTSDQHAITNLIKALPGKMTEKGWSDIVSPGRMWFSSFPDKGSPITNDQKWNNYVRSVESAFIVLDEVQACPLSLLLAISSARALATEEWKADPNTFKSSPTTLMLSATPCGGGVLHFANLLRCLDNDDHGNNAELGLEWPGIAEQLASQVVREGFKGSLNIRRLLVAMGLTVRSIVDVGDIVVIAGAAIERYTVMEKRWDPQSGVELAHLQRIRPATNVIQNRRRGGTRRKVGPLSRPAPVVTSTAVWCPALLCLPSGSARSHFDVQVYLRDQELLVIQGANPRMPPGGILCSYCNIVVVPDAPTIWEHTSLSAACLSVIWDAAGDYSKSPMVKRLLDRIHAMPQDAAKKSQQAMYDELQKQLELLITSEGAVGAVGEKIVTKVQQFLQQHHSKAPEPNFVAVTQRFFLGHTALVNLENSYMYPRARFQLSLADQIQPWRVDEPMGLWVAKYFPDCDITAVEADPHYQELATSCFGTQDAWKKYSVSIEIDKTWSLAGLKHFEVFQKKVLPWMPWAICIVFAAMEAANRDGLPLLYYCFLTLKNRKRMLFNAHSSENSVSELLALAGTRSILMDPRPAGSGAESGGAWRQSLRGAIILAQRILIDDSYFKEDSPITQGWFSILNAFYPKMRGVNPRGQGQSVIQSAPLMRFVALALARYQIPAALAPRRLNKSTDKAKYHQEAVTANLAFLEIVLGGATDGIALLKTDRFTDAIMRSHQLGQDFSRFVKGSGQEIALIISAAGGDVGVDYRDFQHMYIMSPPSTDDELTQTLGRVRRLQGLCNGEERMINYQVICDHTTADAETKHRIVGFKSLALPVSASQLMGRGTTGKRMTSGLEEPMTAWDVIERAARIAAPVETAVITTFKDLDFAAHSLDSRDCVAYLRMIMATYSWKRVVESSANDFGVVGPRDLDLGVSGDAKYYEVLAETLDELTGTVLSNALRLGVMSGAFMPDRGTSNYMSLHLLGTQQQGAQHNVTNWIINQAEFQVGPVAANLLLANPIHPIPPLFPLPDEGSVIFSIIVEATETDVVADARVPAAVAQWGDESNQMLRQMTCILRILASGSESGLITPGTEGILCRKVDDNGEFYGDFQRSDTFAGVSGVELDISFQAHRTQNQLIEVAAGRVESESVWFWACIGALQASLSATAMLNALDGVLEADFGVHSREDSIRYMFKLLLQVYSEFMSQYLNNKDLAKMDTQTAYEYFMREMTPTVYAPTENERISRREIVAQLKMSQAVAGVFAEDNRTIIMPCHPGDAVVSIAATQIQVSTEGDELDQQKLHEVFTKTQFINADHRISVWREIQDEEDVFRPVIVGADPENWSSNLTNWALLIAEITSPEAEEAKTQTVEFNKAREEVYAYPVRPDSIPLLPGQVPLMDPFQINLPASMGKQINLQSPMGQQWGTAEDNMGRVYYYNKSTGESRWKPPNVAAPATVGQLKRVDSSDMDFDQMEKHLLNSYKNDQQIQNLYKMDVNS
jgi:hypothetical protein